MFSDAILPVDKLITFPETLLMTSFIYTRTGCFYETTVLPGVTRLQQLSGHIFFMLIAWRLAKG